MNKKITIVLIAIILALIAIFFMYRTDIFSNHEGTEQNYEQTNTVEETQAAEDTAVDKKVDNEETTVNTNSENKKTSQDKKGNKSQKNTVTPVVKELKVEETHQVNLIDDETDWSLLEKTPRSDVVIVDKAYKIKSPRKYFFK